MDWFKIADHPGFTTVQLDNVFVGYLNLASESIGS
jgi:hypothetical protein